MSEAGKEKKTRTRYNSEYGVHRIFQLCAVCAIAFVVYNIYRSESGSKVGRVMSEAQIIEASKEQFEKMAASPKYKQVSDFVSYIETNTSPAESKILESATGILIYIPNKIIDSGFKNTVIHGENVKISVSGEKKPQLPLKDKVNSQSSDGDNADAGVSGN